MKNDLIDELFKKYYNEAVLYTMSICRDEVLAEDIVSEAFFKALASADEEIREEMAVQEYEITVNAASGYTVITDIDHHD